MRREITEGTTVFETDSTERISAGMPVFYNPVMKLNRDLTLVMLAAMPSWMKAPVRVALPMEASGVRAARILREAVAPGIVVPSRIAINDRSAEAILYARKNVERHIGSFPPGGVAFTALDANVFLRTLGGAEYVDIDPFGTPNPFLDAAVQAVTRGGVLAVTATDTSALAGTYPRATARKYWSVPSRTWAMHEIGLRILIRKVQLVAAQHDRALTPILSIATDHYYRVFFRNDGTGAGRVKAILDRHQPVHVDSRTHTVSPCATGSAGPLWTGPLHDKAVVDAMHAALERFGPTARDAGRLLDLVADEARISALGFVDLHELSSLLGVPCPKRDAVLAALGERAGRTHLCAHGIVTTASADDVARCVHQLANISSNA